METTVVLRTNLRNLIDMAEQRLCSRAYWEFREMFEDLKQALSNYSEEWAYIVENYFKPKCEWMGGICTEAHGCGRY
jgi:thymidylate synthase (FAD)